MSYTDLRDYIEELKRRDLLRVIDEQGLQRYRTGAARPICSFADYPNRNAGRSGFAMSPTARGRNFDASVVLGSLGCSRAVYAAALGVGVDEIGAPMGASARQPSLAGTGRTGPSPL